MRTIITAAILAAATIAPPAASGTLLERCTEFGALSESIMGVRQQGAALSEVLGVLKEERFHFIAIQAFEFPRFSLEKNRKEAAQDFRSEMELLCMKSGSE